MADWSFIPAYGYSISAGEPSVIITRFEDGTESRRRKSSVPQPRTFRGVYVLYNKTDADTAHDFFETKLTNETFTIVSYDPADATDGTATVRFARPITITILSGMRYEIDAEFVEVL